MAGLGSVRESKGTYLSLAGGYIWNRKVDSTHPDYKTQEFSRKDGTVGERAGAQYADLTGKVVGVEFKTHDEYGESVNVTFDADGETYIISISTNNRYSQDMMKALLVMDLEKDVFIKPYDFVDKSKKRAQGVTFRQDGEKLNIRNNDAPSKEKEWFGTATKKEIKRFFEDLSDWFVAEVEEKVIPQLGKATPAAPKAGLGTPTDVKGIPTDNVEETPVEDEVKLPSPVKMKKAIKEYIAENYGDETLPKLSKEDVVVWYKLVLAEDELPFGDDAEVSQADLDAQINALL